MNRIIAVAICIIGLIAVATSVDGVPASMFIGALVGKVAADLWISHD
jgi:hypothetical protein